MSQVLVFDNPETGGISVVHPVGDRTVADIEGAVPEGVPFVVMDSDDLPTTREFRNAWRLAPDTKAIDIDLQAAREVTKDRLRVQREPILASLDVQFMRAIEAGGDASAIVAEKQRLRDITQLADSAKTLDDLRGITLETPGG